MTEAYKDWESLEPFEILNIVQKDPNDDKTKQGNKIYITEKKIVEQHTNHCLPFRIHVAEKNAQNTLPRYFEAPKRSYTSDVLHNVRKMLRLREIQKRSARLLSSTEEIDNHEKLRLQKTKQPIPHIIISSKKRDQKRNVTPSQLMSPIEARMWMKEASMLSAIHAGYTTCTTRCVNVVVDVGIKFISQLGILLKKEMEQYVDHHESTSANDTESNLHLAMSRTLQHIGSGAVQLQDHLFQLAHYGKALRRLDDSLLKAMGPRLEANKKTNTNLNTAELQAMAKIPLTGTAYLFEHMEANGKSSKEIQHILLARRKTQKKKKRLQSSKRNIGKSTYKNQSAKDTGTIIRGGAIVNKNDPRAIEKSRKVKQKKQLEWKEKEIFAKEDHYHTSDMISQLGSTMQGQPLMLAWSQDPCFESRHNNSISTPVPSISNTEEMLDLSNLDDLFTTSTGEVEDLLPSTTF